jgi:EAL domain-containing protein (putative c-di-GMP-specific phosphodiesterase class I)/GGDEF domain-containing protein/PAS domain-containing protein
MDSVNLLVLDRTPESAERINSLLRNSGIKIHVIHVQALAEVNRALNGCSPLLIIYVDPDPVDAGLEEITALSARFSVPCALLCNLDDEKRLVELLKTAACYVIDANNDQQLISTVSNLLESQTSLQASRRQKAHLEELEERYDLLLESARDAIAYIHEGLHVYANKAYMEFLRIKDPSELEGISLLELMKVGEGDLKSILRELSNGNFPGNPIDVQVNRPDASQFDATLVFSPATFNGEPCIQMMLQRRNQEAELAAELERLRITDPLTQLSNRPRFTAQLSEFLAREPSSDSASAVLYAEPDALDRAQLEVGLSGVDAYVLELANVVREYLEEGDEVGRISDHGIAILATRENKQQLEAYARAIQNAYKDVIVEANGRSFSTSCSVGLVTLGRLANDAHDVISQARQAFTEATQEEDNLVVFRPQLTAVAMAEEEGAWVERIRYALKNEDFAPVHESIVDLDGEGEHLIENLIVLRSEESEHPLSEFASVADKHDLSGAIDRSVIPEILKSLADADESQIISLSTHSVADPGFPTWLIDHFKVHAVDANKLVIQVSADAAQANLKPTQRLMKELAPLGCRLSISAFGSERRTLQLFEHLEARYVKLHTALTADLQGNTKAQESIHEIVEAANGNGAVVIADEISDTSNLAILWQCGVKLIAGAFLKETSQVVGQ